MAKLMVVTKTKDIKWLDIKEGVTLQQVTQWISKYPFILDEFKAIRTSEIESFEIRNDL